MSNYLVSMVLMTISMFALIVIIKYSNDINLVQIIMDITHNFVSNTRTLG
ncbi:hypothetical protein [Apilactobacillus timberlakei]|nr:hypothetical protein [Apilactobacillus timberlakei]